MLPSKRSDPGRTAVSNRLFVEVVLWIARTGSPWRDLPVEFGLWNSAYQRFARWSRQGIWHRLFTQLAGDADFEEVFYRQHDCACVSACGRCSQKNGCQALGRSRGGLSTKIHAVVEGLVSLARFHLTGGEAGDGPEALPFLRGLKPGSVSADKAYDSDAILDYLYASNIEAVIPPRSNRCAQREFDTHRYKSRNLVERFFCWIKPYRHPLRQTRSAILVLCRSHRFCHLARLIANRP